MARRSRRLNPSITYDSPEDLTAHSSHNEVRSSTTRLRRGVPPPASKVTVSRSSSHSPSRSSEEPPKRSIHLNFKMPSNKLREATSGKRKSSQNVGVNSRDAFVGGEILTGPRSSRAKRQIVVESASEDEDDDDLMDEEDEEEEEEDDDEDDDVDADGDVDMEDTMEPPRPIIKQITNTKGKSTVKVTTAASGHRLKSVESKEASLDDDDDELSELASDVADDHESTGTPVEEDDEEMVDEGMEEVPDDEEIEEEVDADSDDETGTGTSTPDYAKLTKRQRGKGDEGAFLALPMEPQVKKHLTAEEHAMRRAEMARRRKNLSEKRNEEEKMDTINRLLKKQAPKRRGKAGATDTAGDSTPSAQEIEVEKPKPMYVRWVSNKEGSRIGVPEEWLGTPTGKLFTRTSEGKQMSRPVEEVE
ncbi:MAG: hypothetical protein M1834_002916 [Cirrosporium novae-zelandiae]|nr:MAG: hypothetical protein M1834_002916 [Cirrosporium novae-zelandiae]